MQLTQNRISQHDLSSLPTRVRVLGYTLPGGLWTNQLSRFHGSGLAAQRQSVRMLMPEK